MNKGEHSRFTAEQPGVTTNAYAGVMRWPRGVLPLAGRGRQRLSGGAEV